MSKAMFNTSGAGIVANNLRSLGYAADADFVCALADELDAQQRFSARISEASGDEDPIALIEAAKRLPLTADGVRVVAYEDSVFAIDPDNGIERRRIEHRCNPSSPNKHKNGWWTRPLGFAPFTDRQVSECFSSLAAAEAARGKEGV